jgi:hypothetical protein
LAPNFALLQISTTQTRNGCFVTTPVDRSAENVSEITYFALIGGVGDLQLLFYSKNYTTHEYVHFQLKMLILRKKSSIAQEEVV